MVDWAWPTPGAAFIDPAWLVLQLIAAGHSAEDAESWAADCRAWTDANPSAVDAFATATLRMHLARSERRPDASWITAMTRVCCESAGHSHSLMAAISTFATDPSAARTWACHRRVALG
jgi:hypothetical protein